jgi:rubrerythrin
MYVFIFCFSRSGGKKEAGVAMETTIQYNSGCWRIVLLAGVVRKLLLGLVLEDAIIREESAYRFYESAADNVNGREEQQLLRKLCAEELRHRLKLEELQRRRQTEQIELSQPQEIELFEEEQSWPEVPAQASNREILNLALVKERQAARYYHLLSGRSLMRAVKDLFYFLAGEETEHVRRVEKMLAES